MSIVDIEDLARSYADRIEDEAYRSDSESNFDYSVCTDILNQLIKEVLAK